MPRGVYTGFECTVEKEGVFIPREHQERTVEYCLKSPFRGTLLYHRLGSGKTCTSILGSDQLLKSGYTRAYVMTPGSLRDNFLEEYCRLCGYDSDFLKNRYTFITYNYDVSRGLPQNFNNSIVIIDEVHNLISMVKNKSKVGSEIYDRLMKSRKIKILALSGTPIFSNPVELPLLINLLRPGAFPDVRSAWDHAEYLEMFDKRNKDIMIPLNKKDFMTRLLGVISYYPGTDGDINEFPVIREHEPIVTTMGSSQNKAFYVEFAKEQNLIEKTKNLQVMAAAKSKNRAFDIEDNETAAVLAKLRILSRSVSNFYYPAGKDEPDKFEPDGWLTPEILKVLKTELSPKFYSILENIGQHLDEKHLIYSFYRTHAGVEMLATLLNHCGISTLTFSGVESSEEREEILYKFNHENNLRGEHYKVLLITDAGAEGISLVGVRHVHIVESNTKENRVRQAIGRAARYQSHNQLPVEERTVDVWRYWSKPRPLTSQIKVDSDGKEYIPAVPYTYENKRGEMVTITIPRDFEGIDSMIYKHAKERLHKVESLLDLVKAVSIEKVNILDKIKKTGMVRQM